MNRMIRVALALWFWVSAACAQDDRAVELTYRALFEKDFKGKRDELVECAAKVVQKRLDGCVKAVVRAEGETVVVRLRAESAKDARILIAIGGHLAIREVAAKEAHEKFARDGIVPEDLEKLAAPKDAPKEDGDWLLVRKAGGLGGGDIATADCERDPRTQGWKINVVMTRAAADRFDDLAKRCFDMSPKGKVAIILDGKIMSAPTVQAEKFGGRAEITGKFTEEEAKNLAIAFRCGELPVALGRIVDGKPEPGVPESEKSVAPK